jgi:hypothetical protein
MILFHSFRHHARQVDKPSDHVLQAGSEIFVLEIVHIVESIVGAADIDLLGQNQRPAADFENLPQRQERVLAAVGASGRRA